MEAVRNRNEAVVRAGKITAYTVTVTPETAAMLAVATGLSEEQLGIMGA